MSTPCDCVRSPFYDCFFFQRRPVVVVLDDDDDVVGTLMMTVGNKIFT
jgi:hypothetical protein